MLSFVNLRVLRGLVSVLLLPATSQAQSSFLGFDRNDYPGDLKLKILRQTFAYTGYWLNNPPAATSNSWIGKRATLESAQSASTLPEAPTARPALNDLLLRLRLGTSPPTPPTR